MDRWILCAALLLPSLTSAFEPGDKVVCIRSCEIKDGNKNIETLLPGDSWIVGAENNGLIRDKKRLINWAPANAFATEAEAVAHFRARIQGNPNDVEARCGLAMRLVRSDPAAALAEVEEAVRRQDSSLTLGRLASIHAMRGDYLKAISTLDQAIAAYVEDFRLYEQRATYFSVINQPQKAVDDLTFLIERGQTSRSIFVGRAAAWMQLGKNEEARTDLETQLARDPADEEVAVNLAALPAFAGNVDQALANLDELLRQQPNCASAYEQRGVLLHSEDRLAEAITSLTRATQLDDQRCSAYISRAYCWTQMEKLEQAIDDWSKAIELRPYEADYWGGRGLTWLMKHDEDRALRDLAEAVRRSPGAIRWLAYRAESLIELGRYREAIADLEKIGEIRPGSFKASCDLARLLATCPEDALRDGGRAIKLVSDAYAGPKVNYAVCDALAAAYAETGDFESATKIQQQAIAKAQGKQETEARERLALYESGKPYRLPTKKR